MEIDKFIYSKMKFRPIILLFILLIISPSILWANSEGVSEQIDWWVYPVILFVFTFVLGIISVLAGVGGAVLFVPIVSSFFPFHIDFVRGTGLLIALTGALYATPDLLKRNLASLRLTMPLTLTSSTFAIIGALVGFNLPTQIIEISMGITIVFIVIVMVLAKKSTFPEVKNADRLSSILKINGIYQEESSGERIQWHVHRTPLGMAMFAIVGFIAGMFGLGAGWANVPILNLVLGAPLKIAVGTSTFLLSITDTAAAWVFINKGAIIPIITVPSIAGKMLGTKIGTKLLNKAKPKTIKWLVILFLLFAGVRILVKGLSR